MGSSSRRAAGRATEGPAGDADSGRPVLSSLGAADGDDEVAEGEARRTLLPPPPSPAPVNVDEPSLTALPSPPPHSLSDVVRMRSNQQADGSGRGGGLAKVVHMTGLSVCGAEGIPPEPPARGGRWQSSTPARGSTSTAGSDSVRHSVAPTRLSSGSTGDASRASGPVGRTPGKALPHTPKKPATELLLWLVMHVDEWHRRAAAGPGLILEPLSASLELRASESDSQSPGAEPTPPQRGGRRTSPPELLLSQLRFFDASLVATRLQMRLTPVTIGLLAACVDYLSNPSRFELWRRHRPPEHQTPLTHPRVWWQRAGAAVQAEVLRLRPRYKWPAIAHRREVRRKYVAMYVRFLRAARTGGRVGDSDRTGLLSMERALSYEEVVFYRSLAEAHSKAEADRTSLFISPERQHKLVEATRAAGGALRRFFGLAEADASSSAETADVLVGKTLTDEQRDVLAAILSEADAVDAPPAATDVRARLRVSIPEARLLLMGDSSASPAPPAWAFTPCSPMSPGAAGGIPPATLGDESTAEPRPPRLNLRLVLQSIVLSTAFDKGVPTTSVSVDNAQILDIDAERCFPSVLALQRDLLITGMPGSADTQAEPTTLARGLSSGEFDREALAEEDRLSEETRRALSDGEEATRGEMSIVRRRLTPSLRRMSGRSAVDDRDLNSPFSPGRVEAGSGGFAQREAGATAAGGRAGGLGGRKRGHHRRFSAAIGQTLQALRLPAISVHISPRGPLADAAPGPAAASAAWDVEVKLAPLLATITYGVLEGLELLVSHVPPPRPGVARIVDAMVQPEWRPVAGHADWQSELIQHMVSVEPAEPAGAPRSSLQLHMPLLRLSLPLDDTDAATRQMVFSLQKVAFRGGSYASTAQPSDYCANIGAMAVDIHFPHFSVPLLRSTSGSCRITKLAMPSPGFSNERTVVQLNPDVFIATFTPAVVGTLMGYVDKWSGPCSGYARLPPTPKYQSDPLTIFSFSSCASVFEVVLQHEAAEPPVHFCPEAPPGAGRFTGAQPAHVGQPPDPSLVIGRLRVGSPSLDIHADASLRLSFDGSTFEILAEGAATGPRPAGHHLTRVVVCKPSLEPDEKLAPPPPPLYHQPGGEKYTEARKLASVRRRRYLPSNNGSEGKCSSTSSASSPPRRDWWGALRTVRTEVLHMADANCTAVESDLPALATPPTGLTTHKPVPRTPLLAAAHDATPAVAERPPVLVRCKEPSAAISPEHWARGPQPETEPEPLTPPPLALRLRLTYHMSVPEEAPSVKSLTLELGEASLIWDTASAQLFLRHLYLACREAFPPRTLRPYYLRGYRPLPHDAWNARILCSTLKWSFLDSLCPTPSLVGVLHLNGLDITARLTAACTTDVRVAADLTALDAPPNARLLLEPLEPLLSEAFEARVNAMLRRIREPLDGAACPMELSMTTFNELSSPRASEQDGRTMSTKLVHAPSRVYYHHAGVMRLHDFLGGAVIGAMAEASVPYLGSEAGLSSFEQHFGRVELRMAAAIDSSLSAPEVCLAVAAVSIIKQQPDKLPAGRAGTTITLDDVVLSAPCAEDETHPVDYAQSVGVSEEVVSRPVWTVPRVQLHMLYPLLPGRGLEQGIPESQITVDAGRETELSVTAYQLALLQAVKDYNLGSPPTYVMRTLELPPGTVQLELGFTAENVKLHLLHLADEDEPPALTVELRNLSHRIGWGADLSTAARMTVRKLYAYSDPHADYPLLQARPNVPSPVPVEEPITPSTIPETEPTPSAESDPASAGPSTSTLSGAHAEVDMSQPSSPAPQHLGRRLSFLRHRELRLPSFFGQSPQLKRIDSADSIKSAGSGRGEEALSVHVHEREGATGLRKGSSRLFHRRCSPAPRVQVLSGPASPKDMISPQSPTGSENVTSSRSRHGSFSGASALLQKRMAGAMRILTVPPLDLLAPIEALAPPDLPSPIAEADEAPAAAAAVTLTYNVSAAPESRPTVEAEVGLVNVLLLPRAVSRLLQFSSAATEYFRACYAGPLPTPVVTLGPYVTKLNVEDVNVWMPVAQPTPRSDADDQVQALLCRIGVQLEGTAEHQLLMNIIHRQTGLHEFSVTRRAVAAHMAGGLPIIERFMLKAQYDTEGAILMLGLDGPLRIHVDPYHLRMLYEALSDFRATLAASPATCSPREEGFAAAWNDLQPKEMHGWSSSSLAERVQLDSLSRRDRHVSASVRRSSAMSPGTTAEPSVGGHAARVDYLQPRQRWFRTRVEISEISLLLVSSMRISPTPTLQLLVSKVSFHLDASPGTATKNKEAQLRLNLLVQVDYFNRSIAEWEPVLESAPVTLKLDVDGAASVVLRTENMLEFVLTSQSISALSGYAKGMQTAMSSPLHMVTSRQTRGPYRLRNETGVPLIYGASAATLTHSLSPGEEEEVQIWKDGKVQDRGIRTVALELCAMRATRRVAIDHTGARVVPLRANLTGAHPGGSSGHPLALRCTVEVCDDGFITLLRVQSLVHVANETGVPLQMRVRLVAKAGAARAEHAEDIGSVGAGATLPIPVDMLQGGLVFRPLSHPVGERLAPGSPTSDCGLDPSCEEYDWPASDSTIWLARTITASRSRLYQQASARARRLFSLEDSDYLLEHFRCHARAGCATTAQAHRRVCRHAFIGRRKHAVGERIGGLLYLTSSSICFYSRGARIQHLVPVASVTALEWPGQGQDIVLRWKAPAKTGRSPSVDVKAPHRRLLLSRPKSAIGRSLGQLPSRSQARAQTTPASEPRPELELRLCPARQRQKVYDALEKTVMHQSPHAVKSASAEELRRRFALPPSERLMSSFSCTYDPPAAQKVFFGGYRGELYLFTSHVCFHGRSLDGKEKTRVLLLEHLVSLERKMGSWGLGRLSSALIVSTLDEQLLFSAFWRPQTTLKALIEAWEHAQELADERTGDADDGNPLNIEDAPVELRDDDFQAMRLPQVIVCYPGGSVGPAELPSLLHASFQSSFVEWEASDASAADAVPPSAEHKPFYCCVRVSRQQLPSSGRAATQSIQTVAISLHTPLTLQSALPFPVRWTVLSSQPLPFSTKRGHWPPSYFSRISSRIGGRRSVVRPAFVRETSNLSVRSAGGSTRNSATSRFSHRAAKGRRNLGDGAIVFHPVASGTVEAFGIIHCHDVDPNQRWQLVIVAEGFEPTAPFLVHRGIGSDAQAGKLPETVELYQSAAGASAEPSASKNQHSHNTNHPERTRMTVHIDNSLHGGTFRKVNLFAPYWLVNKTGLPLTFKEVRMGRNKRARSQTMGEAPHGLVADELDVEAGTSATNPGSHGFVRSESRSAMPTLMESDDTQTQEAWLCSASGRASRQSFAADEESPRDSQRASDDEGSTTGIELQVADDEVLAEAVETAALAQIEARVQPQLFSFSHRRDRFASRLAIRLGNGSQNRSWSKPFSIEAVDTRNTLRCGGMEFGLAISRAPSLAAQYSNEITFGPRYLIRSELPFPIRYRQKGVADSELVLLPRHEEPFNWASHKGELLVELALHDGSAGRSVFTCGFHIDNVDEFQVRCGQPVQGLEVVSENQRRRTSSSPWSADHLLPTDRHGAWSDANLDYQHMGGLNSIEPPPEWEWAEPGWTLDPSPRDPDGWEYGTHWPSSSLNTPRMHAEPFLSCFVRRRRWIRRRRIKPDYPAALRERLLAITIQEMGASVVVRISDGTTRPPQYEIENASAAAIMVQQRDYPGQRAHLGAGQSMPFVWTAVADKRVLDVWLSAPMVHARVLLDKVNSECTVDWAGIPISLFVVARGAARILVVAPKIEEIAATALPSLRFKAQVCGVGLSLVRSGVQELAYMRLSGLVISVMLEPTVHTFNLMVENMRLDNQTKVAQLPAVVIRSSYVTRHRNIVGDEVDAREQRKLYSLELAVVRDKLDHSGHSFRSFKLDVVEFDIQIEERFVREMIGFGQLLLPAAAPAQPLSGRAGTYPPKTPRRNVMGSARRHRATTPRYMPFARNNSDEKLSEAADGAPTLGGAHPPTPRRPAAGEGDGRGGADIRPSDRARSTSSGGGQPSFWYFKELKVGQLKLNITYVQSQQPFHALANAVIPNLDRVPLQLEKVNLSNSFNTPQHLMHVIKDGYKKALLPQFYKLVLHIEVFGNPVELVKGMGAGMRDFVVLPARGLMESPEDFGRGIVNGSWSFMRGVVGGPSRTVSQVAGSLSRRVTAMSMDGQYIEDRTRRGQDARNHGPRHAVEGLRFGAEGFGRGVVEGVAGLISQPIEGAQTQGVRGLVKGAGKGLVGLALKPTAGMLDFAQRTMEGFARTFEYIEDARSHVRHDAETDPHERMRMPRMLHGPAATVRPYSHDEADARIVLELLRGGVYMKEPILLTIKMNGTQILVMTSHRMLLASAKDHRCHSHYPLHVISDVQQDTEACTVGVVLRPTTELQPVSGKPHGGHPLLSRLGQSRRTSLNSESTERPSANQRVASCENLTSKAGKAPAGAIASTSSDAGPLATGTSTAPPLAPVPARAPSWVRLSKPITGSSNSLFEATACHGGISTSRRGGLGARIQHAVLGTARHDPAMHHIIQCGTAEACQCIAEQLILGITAIETGQPYRPPKRAMPGMSTEFFARAKERGEWPGLVRSVAGSTELLSNMPPPAALFSDDVPYLRPMESNIALMEGRASREDAVHGARQSLQEAGDASSAESGTSPVWSVASPSITPPTGRFSSLSHLDHSKNSPGHPRRPPASPAERKSVLPGMRLGGLANRDRFKRLD